MSAAATDHPTACVLCAQNCGVLVEVEDGHLKRVRGDKAHPISEGYLCQKASRLDYYQNGPDRVTEPLRRRADGSFEAVSWEVAIAGVAAELKRLRDSHGGHTLAYYGGGGQGNHLGGAHSSSLRAAMGTRYIYNALAQEKTGGFWVNGRLFGRQTCHPSEDVEKADFVLFIGTNPWQSHGFPRARAVLGEIARDPARTMVVVDPRRTETAERADIHLQVRPGADAQLMLGLLGILVQEELVDRAFLAARTTGYEALQARFAAVDVEECARLSGVDAEALRQVARGLAGAKAGCVRTDLGLEHSLNSTLNTWLSKLLFLLTGQFGKPGTVNLHASLVPLIGHSRDPEAGGRTTRVTGMREISKLYPPNVLPQEINTEHPERIRGVVVDSGNPMVTGADTHAYRAAFEKLELLVVIDVAMTETARMAHWVLPVATQFEKWEATFFNLEFPKNFFHLRRPVLPAPESVLTEQELYRRIAVAMGELPDDFPLLRRVARLDRRLPRLRLFPLALAATLKLRPALRPHFALVLHETLGRALPVGDAATGPRVGGLLWGACHQFARAHAAAVKRAGVQDTGAGLGEALFERVMHSPSGAVVSVHTHEEMWGFIEHKDGRIHLLIEEMLAELDALAAPGVDQDFPLVLMAGERRAFNANTIIRDEGWRKRDPSGSLKVHSADAEKLGLADGDAVVCESARGQLQAVVAVSDEMLPGVVSLPHGFGMEVADEDGKPARQGPRINELTASDHCDPIARTPYHKHVRVRLRPAAV